MLFLFPLFSLSHKSAEGRSSYSLSYKVTVHINKEGCEYEEAKTVDVTLLECTCLQFVVASFQRFFFLALRSRKELYEIKRDGDEIRFDQ